jgi:hypothetical protein
MSGVHYLQVNLCLMVPFFVGLHEIIRELNAKLSTKDFQKLEQKIRDIFYDGESIKFKKGVFVNTPIYFALEHLFQSRTVSTNGKPMLPSISDKEKFFIITLVIWSPKTQSLFLHGTYDGKSVDCILVQGRTDQTRFQLKKSLLSDSEKYLLKFSLKIKTTEKFVYD